MAKKSKYTSAQKKAFARGQGYKAAKAGKKIAYKDPKLKKAFRDGYQSKR